MERITNLERTTNLKKIKNGAAFTWGSIIQIHEIGEYSIVEHHPWKVDGCTVLTGIIDETTRDFSCYINGKSISISAGSLDEALATCIAHKHEGANQQASYYFMKMIRKE